MSLEKTDKVIAIVRHIFEILAIIGAGIWAYFLYFKKDQPTLEESIQVTSHIKLEEYNKKECLALVTNEIKNIGRSSFDIKDIQSATIVVPIDCLFSNNNKVQIDVEGFLKRRFNEPVDSYVAKRHLHVANTNRYINQLSGHYSPDITKNETIANIFPNNANKAIIAYIVVIPQPPDTDEASNSMPIIKYSWKAQLLPDKK